MASTSSETIALPFLFLTICAAKEGGLQAPRVASPRWSDRGTPLPVPPSRGALPSTGLWQKLASHGVRVPKYPLCLTFCFLGIAVVELDDRQADLRGRGAGEVKIPRKKDIFIPSIPSVDDGSHGCSPTIIIFS